MTDRRTAAGEQKQGTLGISQAGDPRHFSNSNRMSLKGPSCQVVLKCFKLPEKDKTAFLIRMIQLWPYCLAWGWRVLRVLPSPGPLPPTCADPLFSWSHLLMAQATPSPLHHPFLASPHPAFPGYIPQTTPSHLPPSNSSGPLVLGGLRFTKALPPSVSPPVKGG